MQSLVDIIKHGLTDENQKVKTITSLSIAALAEAAAPYGIESFDDVLEPLWKGIRLLRYTVWLLLSLQQKEQMAAKSSAARCLCVMPCLSGVQLLRAVLLCFAAFQQQQHACSSKKLTPWSACCC